MATFAIVGLDQTPETLLNGEFGFVGRTGELVVTAADAIVGSGQNELYVRGNITSASNNFLHSVYDFDGTLVDVFVDETGSIFSGDTALDLAATSGVEVINDGRIIADGTAISATASDGGATMNFDNNGYINGLNGIFANSGFSVVSISNSGVISANGTAILSAGTGNTTLTNTGTISSAVTGIALAGGNDIVVNTGTIVGTIDLGAGNDLFDGTNGTQGGSDFINLGSGADTFMGGAGAEFVSGGGGLDADEIRTGGGDDTIRGSEDLSNDLYDGGSGQDLITFLSVSGDLFVHLVHGVATGASVGVDQLVSIEHVTSGSGDDTILGNTDDNVIRSGAGNDRAFGDGGNDRLRGGFGNDTLRGEDGNDRLFGEEDNDRLIGGNGRDYLVGGLGRDKMTGDADQDAFVFLDIADSGAAAGTLDRITDFQQGLDKIDVSGIDADLVINGDNPFTFIGNAAFSGSVGELRFRQTATLTIVEMDQDGDGVTDSSIRLDGVINLGSGDFVL